MAMALAWAVVKVSVAKVGVLNVLHTMVAPGLIIARFVKLFKLIVVEGHVLKVAAVFTGGAPFEFLLPHAESVSDYLWSGKDRGIRFYVSEGKVSWIAAGDETIRYIEGCA